MQNIFANLTFLSDPDISSKVTIIVCGLIVIISLFGFIGRWRATRKNHLISPWTALAPSAVISLGIFLGLTNFDRSDINSSMFIT